MLLRCCVVVLKCIYVYTRVWIINDIISACRLTWTVAGATTVAKKFKEDDAAGGEQRKKIFMALLLCSRAFMKYHEFVSYLFHIHTHDVNISRQ